MMISIIVPTYKREQTLRAAIHSIKNQYFQNWEILVLDNEEYGQGVTKDVVVAFNDSRIRYLQLSIKGCTNARNVGANESGADLFLFIDDDIEFLQVETLSRLEQLFNEQPDIGIVGAIEMSNPDCKLTVNLSADISTVGKISSAGEVNTGFDSLYGRDVTDVDHVRSAFLAIPRVVFKKVGGIDRAYDCLGYGFRAETDLCMKVKRAGYRVVVDPGITIWHKVAQRKDAKFKRSASISYSYYANRNHFIFMNRFFWKGKVTQNALAVIFGASRPMSPGRYLYAGIRNFKVENAVFALVALFAAIKGFFYYIRFDLKNDKKSINNC
jgi:GT2 family glycosyltransferase